MPIETHVPDATFVTAIAELKQPVPETHKIYDRTILTLGMEKFEYEDPKEPEPQALKVTTLSAIVDYVQSELPSSNTTDKIIVHVKSPTEVEITAPLVGDQRQKFIFMNSVPALPTVHLNRYLSPEDFLIQLQSSFEPGEARVSLQRECGDIKSGIEGRIVDDGVSQEASVRAGITRAKEKKLENQWRLAPFRTFSEVNQPISTFVLRIRQKPGSESEAEIALFEADGGAWRSEAITSIKDWLVEKLGADVIILA